MTQAEHIDSLQDIMPDQILELDLRPYAESVECLCGEQLKDPPKGIYQVGKISAVMLDGNNYYTHDKAKGTVLIKDINTIDTPVYDGTGKIVVPSYVMRNKAKMLSNSPTLPYTAVHLLKALVDNQINSFVCYRRGGAADSLDIIRKYLKPGLQADVEETIGRQIEDVSSRLRANLHDFMGHGVWLIYFTRLHETSLQIQKCMDWRAWEWEQKHGKQFRMGQYS